MSYIAPGRLYIRLQDHPVHKSIDVDHEHYAAPPSECLSKLLKFPSCPSFVQVSNVVV